MTKIQIAFIIAIIICAIVIPLIIFFFVKYLKNKKEQRRKEFIQIKDKNFIKSIQGPFNIWIFSLALFALSILLIMSIALLIAGTK